MLPGVYHLTVYRGDTTRLQFRLWQDEAKTIPLNLGGATAAAQIRERPDSTAVMGQLGCVVTGNQIDVTIAAAAAAALKPKGAWDLQVTWPNGDVQTVVAGSATIAPDVTRGSV